MIRMLASIALGISALAAAPASAASAETYLVTIPAADLNLANPAGMRTLEGRVRAAARNLCGTPSTPSIADRQRVMMCEREFVANAREKIGLGRRGQVIVIGI